jgi:hypothetical protein
MSCYVTRELQSSGKRGEKRAGLRSGRCEMKWGAVQHAICRTPHPNEVARAGASSNAFEQSAGSRRRRDERGVPEYYRDALR